jgi:hypothetical protein
MSCFVNEWEYYIVGLQTKTFVDWETVNMKGKSPDDVGYYGMFTLHTFGIFIAIHLNIFLKLY